MVAIDPNLRDNLLEENARAQIEDANSEGIISFGTINNDRISGSQLADVIFGLTGNDRIVANNGADIVFADEGNDTVVGGGGSDILVGGSGNDRVDGGSGNDTIVGGSGEDILIGRTGNDSFEAGEDDDILIGGGGSDDAHFASNILDDEGNLQFEHTRISNNRFTVEDLFGPLGLDDLRSVETIKFDDFTIFTDGRNNGPVAFDDETTTDEDNPVTINILENDVDFDRDFLGLDDDLMVFGSTIDAMLIDNISILPDGTFTFDPLDDYQFLAEGESATEIVNITIVDNGGLTSQSTTTITILGVNDQPLTMDIDLSANEDDANITVNLADFSSDVDATDILTYQLFGPDEIRGSISIDPVSGEVTFELGDDFQFLNAGESEVLEFTYTATDDSGTDTAQSEPSTLTITINGSDDADVETSDTFEFMSEDQSTFGTGSALVLEPDLPFIGLETSFSDRTTIIPSIDILVADTPAVGVDFSFDARIGLQPIFTLTSGDIDSELTGELTFLVPDQVVPGQEITLQSGFTLSDGSFQTFSPNITLGLDLIFDLASRLAFFVGSDDFEIFDFDVSEVIELFRFSGEDAMLEIPLPADSSLTVGFPVINTTSEPFTEGGLFLESTGESNPILSATFDVDGLITSLLNTAGIPIPALENSIDFDFAGFTFTAFYNLLDLEFVGDLTVQQDFNLSLGDLSGVLTLENGDIINFTPGEDITFIVPEDFDVDGDEILDFTTQLDINGDANDDSIGALLDQVASLNFDLDFDVSLLSGGISAEFLGVGLGSFEIGPLFETSIDVFDADSFATIFNDEFGLIGFNTDTGDFGIDASLLNASGLEEFMFA